MKPERLAQIFHEAYEELAPKFGYKTREASAVPWADVPEGNKTLMIATAECVLQAIGPSAALEALEEAQAENARLQARVEEAIASAGQAWHWYNREAKIAGELIWADSEREEMQEQRDRYKALAERLRKGLEKYGKHGVLCRYGLLPEGESRQDFSTQENERLEALSIKECTCGFLAALATMPEETGTRE